MTIRRIGSWAGSAIAWRMLAACASLLPVGCAGTELPLEADSSESGSEEARAEMRARWNVVADARPPSIYEFHWVENRFPHPTFQMGTEEGYYEFAFVLIDFLEGGDNFDFIVDNHLTRVPLRYLDPDGEDMLEENFKDLVEFFSTSTFGGVPAHVQLRLAAYVDQMNELE